MAQRYSSRALGLPLLRPAMLEGGGDGACGLNATRAKRRSARDVYPFIIKLEATPVTVALTAGGGRDVVTGGDDDNGGVSGVGDGGSGATPVTPDAAGGAGGAAASGALDHATEVAAAPLQVFEGNVQLTFAAARLPRRASAIAAGAKGLDDVGGAGGAGGVGGSVGGVGSAVGAAPVECVMQKIQVRDSIYVLRDLYGTAPAAPAPAPAAAAAASAPTPAVTAAADATTLAPAVSSVPPTVVGGGSGGDAGSGGSAGGGGGGGCDNGAALAVLAAAAAGDAASGGAATVPVAPLAEDDDGKDRGRECVVCLTSERCVVLMPCRHLCVCPACAEQVMRPTVGGSANDHAARCPVCRRPVQALIRVGSSSGALTGPPGPA